jgi:hypothetical protein
MIVVQRYADHMAAEFDRAVLEANGIQALIVTDDAGGMLPLPSLGVIRLMVHADDAERALAALAGGPEDQEEDGAASPEA